MIDIHILNIHYDAGKNNLNRLVAGFIALAGAGVVYVVQV
jgi:hypothetical protein